MLGALADREDRRVRRAHLVVDHDAAADPESGCPGQGGIGPDTHRHHEQFGGQDASVAEPKAGHAAIAADDFLGVRL